MDKKEIRNLVRQQKRALTQEQIRDMSQILGKKFRESEAYSNARTIYGYLPYNQEVLTTPMLIQALEDGKRVAVPKVYGDEMRFIYVEDFCRIAPGYCNIPEPLDDEPVADDETALVLMPGLAFDREGHRIGYGGGFYDKFLSAEPDHPTLALFNSVFICKKSCKLYKIIKVIHWFTCSHYNNI